jgi:hypothetical protein
VTWSDANSSCGVKLDRGKRYVIYTHLVGGRMRPWLVHAAVHCQPALGRNSFYYKSRPNAYFGWAGYLFGLGASRAARSRVPTQPVSA